MTTIHDDVEERLTALGIILPEASGPAASYANYVFAGGLLFVSGKGPSSKLRGKLSSDFTTEEGYLFAREAAIEVLAVVKSAVDSLSLVKQVVKAQGFVNADPQFDEHHKVLNGFSDVMLEVFGEKGVHARSVFGACSLREQLPIIIDSIFEVSAFGSEHKCAEKASSITFF
ncbi:enamine deaminase RidA (YjgF/YER057c/UK114 family) [Paenibacillus endophyticus]|uniref:Enamine deaminase RidA (YjgF/YER057c/UK114 family) n=1 Tax=Paenibacillus endophyticus TaxID=1294268 RepID=A0A7W5CA52_9BACL|nr:RidA family protein [Paenibacillus endophyticus]MBB3153962.1 enamine deaminase RidA (YjgF/YER057c/UK114 family) [Paenibacillus endophyticus]